jgi:hypothetical protein
MSALEVVPQRGSLEGAYCSVPLVGFPCRGSPVVSTVVATVASHGWSPGDGSVKRRPSTGLLVAVPWKGSS